MLLMKKYKQLTSEQRYAIYLGLENGDTQRTIASLIGVSPSAVSRELQRNKDVIRTITTDNGLEFAAHERITEMLEAPVYFTDPYSAWQKGSIENANKLIRQYIPKGASFKDYPPDRLKRIQHRLNERPRKKLDFNTPKVEFYKQLM
ncbi:IS30 family transposase [Petrimonas mucosa]|jgi:IS30 family transposase|uniref:Transposase for insertion sequence element IS4351 n=2 Tax=Petrimonas mucosa TaxID=1642646 RepID=A0A1G4G402_9BACT|nr:Transposase for insertion sequence element IS4351 [Petrimonas mucosa]